MKEWNSRQTYSMDSGYNPACRINNRACRNASTHDCKADFGCSCVRWDLTGLCQTGSGWAVLGVFERHLEAGYALRAVCDKRIPASICDAKHHDGCSLLAGMRPVCLGRYNTQANTFLVLSRSWAGTLFHLVQCHNKAELSRS